MATLPFTQLPTTLPVAAGSLLANANISTQVASIVLHNTNTTTENVQLYLVPNNAGALGAAALTNRISSIQLAPNDMVEIFFKFPLTMAGTNDAIFGQTTTASKVTATLSGVKNS